MIRKIGLIGAAALLATAAPAPAQEATPITDAQIAHVAYTAGQLDIEAAKQALERSRNAEVRAFAETMVRDHAAVNDQALALVKKLGITPVQLTVYDCAGYRYSNLRDAIAASDRAIKAAAS